MTFQSWLIYLALVLVATATPGPAVLFIMTNAALHGWRKAAFAALGNVTGLFCLGVISVTGLGVILKSSETIFNVIKYAGAAYLIYLGVKLIRRKTLTLSANNSEMISAGVRSGKIFARAFLVAVSNPKAIVFLTALFPQFVNMHGALAPQFSILIVTLMLFSFCFLMFYARLADNAKNWLTRPGRINAVNRTSGSIFISFGILLANSSMKQP